MTSANEQVVRDAVTAMTTGDMDSLPGYFDDNVVVHVPGTNQISGDYDSKAAFFGDFLGKIMGLTEGSFVIEPHDFASSDDHVVGIYDITATRDGREYSYHHVNVYHVRDGKIAEVWQHPGDSAAWNDFWS
jgi:uncharacterized protein